MDPLPRIDIFVRVSSCSLFNEFPRGPRSLPTKLNCNRERRSVRICAFEIKRKGFSYVTRPATEANENVSGFFLAVDCLDKIHEEAFTEMTFSGFTFQHVTFSVAAAAKKKKKRVFPEKITLNSHCAVIRWGLRNEENIFGACTRTQDQIFIVTLSFFPWIAFILCRT